MMDKRRILEAVINGDVTALNQLPPITLFCISDNYQDGTYTIKPPHGQSLPTWVKPEMKRQEIEAVKRRYQVVLIIIDKAYE